MADALGRQVADRYTPPHARRAARVPAERRAGMVARKAAEFGYTNGRSVFARRAIGQNVVARIGSTDLLPVGMPFDMWLAVAERQRMRPSPSVMEQRVQAVQRLAQQRSAPRGLAARVAAAGPRGLPRATARGRLSPVGRDTGPAAAPHRMLTEAAFVANPDEVRAAGPMLGTRDQSRAVMRRAATGPPSPSTGGGRARRAAQASGPGRQVGATRPTAAIAGTEFGVAAPGSAVARNGGPGASSSPSPSPRSPGSVEPGSRAAPTPSSTSPSPVPYSAPPLAAALPIAGDAFGRGHVLPRPGAVARRGAVAARLRRLPEVTRPAARLGVAAPWARADAQTFVAGTPATAAVAPPAGIPIQRLGVPAPSARADAQTFVAGTPASAAAAPPAGANVRRLGVPASPARADAQTFVAGDRSGIASSPGRSHAEAFAVQQRADFPFIGANAVASSIGVPPSLLGPAVPPPLPRAPFRARCTRRPRR